MTNKWTLKRQTHEAARDEDRCLIPFFFTDQKTYAQSHQAAHERLYGLVSTGEKENHWSHSGQTQRGNLQGIGQTLEIAARGGSSTFHWWSRKVANSASKGVSRLQVQAAQETQKLDLHLQFGLRFARLARFSQTCLQIIPWNRSQKLGWQVKDQDEAFQNEAPSQQH